MATENRIIYKHIDVEGWNASIEKYMSDGGYGILAETVKRDRAELCAEMEKSKIKGRGGAEAAESGRRRERRVFADAERNRGNGRFGGGAATGRTLERRVGKTRQKIAAPPPTVGTSEQAPL